MRNDGSFGSASGSGPGVAPTGDTGPFDRRSRGEGSPSRRAERAARTEEGGAGGASGPRVLVLCAGSVLMGDDGVGLAALERLREGWETGPGVELLDGGTWGMNLLPAIEAADRLLVVDAVRAGRDPGSVVRLEEDEVPRFFATKLSPHQIDLKEVLALAELRGTLPATVAVGIEPGRVELSTELSPEVEAALPALVERIAETLREWGVDVRRTGRASMPAPVASVEGSDAPEPTAGPGRTPGPGSG